jgi:spore coat protein U-like protein
MSYCSRIALLLLAGLGVSAQVNAQVSSSASATTTVVDPAVITKTSDLDFGQIEAGGPARTIVVSPHETSGEGAGKDSGQGASPATITIEGASDQSYSISLLQGTHSLARQNGNETVKVKDFTSDIPDGLLLSGSQTINIGATLLLEDKQAAGLYNSQAGIPVIVNYN